MTSVQGPPPSSQMYDGKDNQKPPPPRLYNGMDMSRINIPVPMDPHALTMLQPQKREYFLGSIPDMPSPPVPQGSRALADDSFPIGYFSKQESLSFDRTQTHVHMPPPGVRNVSRNNKAVTLWDAHSPSQQVRSCTCVRDSSDLWSASGSTQHMLLPT